MYVYIAKSIPDKYSPNNYILKIVRRVDSMRDAICGKVAFPIDFKPKPNSEYLVEIVYNGSRHCLVKLHTCKYEVVEKRLASSFSIHFLPPREKCIIIGFAVLSDVVQVDVKTTRMCRLCGKQENNIENVVLHVDIPSDGNVDKYVEELCKALRNAGIVFEKEDVIRHIKLELEYKDELNITFPRCVGYVLDAYLRFKNFYKFVENVKEVHVEVVEKSFTDEVMMKVVHRDGTVKEAKLEIHYGTSEVMLTSQDHEYALLYTVLTLPRYAEEELPRNLVEFVKKVKESIKFERKVAKTK